jgi:hypothetical protein
MSLQVAPDINLRIATSRLLRIETAERADRGGVVSRTETHQPVGIGRLAREAARRPRGSGHVERGSVEG